MNLDLALARARRYAARLARQLDSLNRQQRAALLRAFQSGLGARRGRPALPEVSEGLLAYRKLRRSLKGPALWQAVAQQVIGGFENLPAMERRRRIRQLKLRIQARLRAQRKKKRPVQYCTVQGPPIHGAENGKTS